MAVWVLFSERSIDFDRNDLPTLGRVAVIGYNPDGLKIQQEVSSVKGTILEEKDFIVESGMKIYVGQQFRRFIGSNTFAELLRRRVYEKLKQSGVIQLISDETIHNLETSFIRKQPKTDKLPKPSDQFKSPEELQETRPDYKIIRESINPNTILELRVETAFIKPLKLSITSYNYQFSVDVYARMFRLADENILWRKTFSRLDRITEVSKVYEYENLAADDGFMVRRIIDHNSAVMAKMIYDDLNLEGS
jgi:hypothetical protein